MKRSAILWAAVLAASATLVGCSQSESKDPSLNIVPQKGATRPAAPGVGGAPSPASKAKTQEAEP